MCLEGGLKISVCKVMIETVIVKVLIKSILRYSSALAKSRRGFLGGEGAPLRSRAAPGATLGVIRGLRKSAGPTGPTGRSALAAEIGHAQGDGHGLQNE